MKTILACLLLSSVLTLFPLPKSVVYHSESPITANHCNLHLVHPNTALGFDPTYYFDKLMKREFGQDVEFECNPVQMMPILITLDKSLPKEKYHVKVMKDHIVLEFSTQRGYIYSLETLFQVIDDGKAKLCTIVDEPLVAYRGIMLDSVRHFLSTKAIKRTI